MPSVAQERVREVFRACLRTGSTERRAEILERECHDDQDLKSAVVDLLEAHAASGSFLEKPLDGLLKSVVAFNPAQNSGADVPLEVANLKNQALGDYRILREIARGGMGVVYEAEQLSLGRKVALKVLPFAAMLDKTQLARFKNEARAAASLDHPNVVHVHSVGSERGVHYYAMQLIDGQTVAEVITQEQRRRTGPGGSESREQAPATSSFRGASPNDPVGDFVSSDDVVADSPTRVEPEAFQDTGAMHAQDATTKVGGNEKERIRCVVELAIQAAEALEHAHQMGVVHRDIKPSNLLIDAEQHLWVADFGLAMVEAEGDLTASGSMLGTLRYMSPEQMRADRRVLDHRTDIYSLGATLYEMLTLQPAFPDNDVTRLMQRIPNDEPTAPRKLNSAVPRDLETIVLKAMAKDCDDRYATAAALAADLHRFLDDEPIEAKPPGMVERARKWARRHRAVVATAVATLFVAVTVAGALLWNERSDTLAALDRETEQRERAEEQESLAVAAQKLADQRLAQSRLDFDRALEALDTVVEELSSPEFGQIPGVEKTRSDVLKRMLALYEDIADEHDDDPYARQQQALAYGRIAGILSLAGQKDEATIALNQGISILDELLQANPDDRDYRLRLAEQLFRRAANYPTSHRLKDAERALALRQQLVEPGSSEHISWCASYHCTVAKLLPEDSPLAYEHIADSIRITKEHGLTPPVNSYSWLAKHAEKKGDFAESEKNYRLALEILSEKTDAESRWGRGAYSRLCGQFAKLLNSMGRFDEARTFHLKSIESFQQIYREYGKLRVYERQFRDTVLRYVRDAKTERQKDEAAALLNQAIEEFRKATAVSEELVHEHPHVSDHQARLASSQRLLASLLKEGGRADEANKLLLDTSIAEPRTAAEYVQRAGAFEQLKKYENALADYAKAIELDDTNGSAFAERSALYSTLERYDEALPDLLRLVNSDHVTEYWIDHLVDCYVKLGRHDEALADLNKMISLEPGESWLYKRRAEAYFRLDRFDESLADLNKALELDSSEAPPHNRLAWLLATCPEEAVRDADRAVELAKKAVELEPEKGAYWNTLGVAQYRQGDYPSAIESLTKSTELRDGGGSSDFLFLAMASWRHGDQDQARRWYDKAVQWIDDNKVTDDELSRFREEAEALGIASEAPQPEESDSQVIKDINRQENESNDKR